MKDKDLSVFELTEESIESMIYRIRGQRVMLDFDLARIYGYETKRFNEQVKNNIERFPEDFMFQLTREEMEQLSRPKIETTSFFETESEESSWSKKSALNKSGDKRGNNRKYSPYAFTEQGVYMLMAVLKGELAIRQSKALIRLFKKMKDYIVENSFNASLINNKFASYDKRFEKVEEKLEIVMDNFLDPSTYKHFLILDGQKIEADIAYQTIYTLAKASIYIVDNYVGIKTLHLLKACSKNIEIILFSNNKAKNPLTQLDVDDFKSDTGLSICLKATNNRFHDRYIIIDYNTSDEIIYHCGASSKDAGKKVTTIMKEEMTKEYHYLIDELLNNKETNAEKKQ